MCFGSARSKQICFEMFARGSLRLDRTSILRVFQRKGVEPYFGWPVFSGPSFFRPGLYGVYRIATPRPTEFDSALHPLRMRYSASERL